MVYSKTIFKYLILIVIIIFMIGVVFYETHKNKSESLAYIPTPIPTSNPIQHVVVIVFENQQLNDVLKNGSYFNYLYKTYGSASNYYAICHPSTSNYLAMTGGTTQCGSDAINLYSTTNIGTLLENENISHGGNLSWYAFMESMPSPCYRSDSGQYAVRHNPFAFYADLVNSNLCAKHDLSLDAWNNSVNTGNIPNYSFISPNIRNDGHDTSVIYADNWLKGFLGPLLTKPWAQNTVFFIVFDESVESDVSGFNGFNGGHTYLVAVSPYSKMLTFSGNVTDYNLLTTIEWLLNLGTTGNNDDPSKYPPMTGLFNFATSMSTADDPVVNLLLNPGFEDGTTGSPDHWTKYYKGTAQPFSYPEPGRIGGSSVAISFKIADKEADWVQSIRGINSTNIYKISGWMKTQNISTGSNNGATIHIDWYDFSGDYINTSRIIVPKIQGTTEWAYFEKFITNVPPDATNAHVVLKMLNASGKVWFDDMSFSRN